MRWGELVALRWDDLRPRRTGRGVEKGPKTEPGKRFIALDRDRVWQRALVSQPSPGS